MEPDPEFNEMRREVGEILSPDGGKRPTFFGKLLSEAWELAKIVIVSLVIVLPIRLYIAQPFIVRGASMEPNFANGEYLIVDELSYRLADPARGDVIVFRYPQDPSQFFIKRIVGLPGERVEIRGGEVLLLTSAGGKTQLEEAYLSPRTVTAPDAVVTLGPNEYFVMGDNRSASSDSRRWGPLARGFVIGKAWVRLWPVAHAGFVGNL